MSLEDHMTGSGEEAEDSQRSKLLNKMSRLGGQAILPPGSLPGAQVVKDEGWGWGVGGGGCGCDRSESCIY